MPPPVARITVASSQPIPVIIHASQEADPNEHLSRTGMLRPLPLGRTDPAADRMVAWRAAARRVEREWHTCLAAEPEQRTAAYVAYEKALCDEELAAAQLAPTA
jgi:hypothetical protein